MADAATAPKASNRIKPSVGLPPNWWPVALADEVEQHPLQFRLGTRNLAVYRDLGGVVRAVDDSCPHRRLPLSMGRITEDGYLQCAYHGWCFDGADGRCTQIPNLREDEKIPGAIRINAFSTVENIADVLGFGLRFKQLAPAVGPPTGEEPEDGGTTMFESLLEGGLVLVWTGEEAPSAPVRSPGELSGDHPRAFSGRVEVRAPHARLAAALLHNPGQVLGLGALIGSGEELSRPDIEQDGDTLVVRRERLRFNTPRPHTFDPFVKSDVATEVRMIAATGLAWMESAGVRVVAGLTPIGDYRTILRWYGEADGPANLVGRALSVAGVRSGRTTARAEELADAIFGLPDAAVEKLRDLQASHAEQTYDPGTRLEETP